MKVQEFIFDNGLDALTEHLGVEVKRYPNGYVKLNYSQIDSPNFHPISDECRGVVLWVDDQNRSKVICRPFKRFYNFGQGWTQDFDFSNCTVWEKADGTLVMIYWSPEDNRWEIGTRGMAYAEGNFVFSMTASGGQFKDWILKAMGVSFDEFQRNMSDVDHGITFLMEFVGPENQIVTRYESLHMVFLGVIDNKTGKEESPDCSFPFFAEWMNVRMPQRYEAASGDDLVKLADSLPNLQEGFVVFDHNTGERVKIKSKTYAAVHHLRGNGVPSVSRMMEVVLMNEQDELLTYFPMFKEYVDPIEDALRQLLDEAVEVYCANKKIESQKDFALLVKDRKVAPIMFKARKDGVGVYEAFESMDMSQRVKLLEKYYE
jgi:RNA ligase